MRPAALTAALGLLLLLAAGTFDAEPLYVGGVAFAAVGVLALAWVLVGGLGVRVERDLSAHTVVEDEPVVVRVRVRAGLTPLPTGRVEEALLGQAVPLAPGRREMALQITARFARRGRRELTPSRVVVADPLALAARTVAVGPSASVLVLPAVLPVRGVGGEGDGGRLVARAGRPRIAAEVELDGLRPYRLGATASRIQWSAYARTGELYERRLTADADARPLIVLDPRAGDGPDAREQLDAAVRATASLVVVLARDGGCALLLPGDRRAATVERTLATWPRAHARLALIGDDGHAPGLTGVAGRGGPILYVCARPVGALPRALADGGGGPRILVAPGAPGGRRALFTVAGCTGSVAADRRRRAA